MNDAHKARPRVLLVEDNPADRALLRAAFEDIGRGLAVREAVDGQAAMSLLVPPDGSPGFMPNLVLLDLNLPRMSGIEFLQEARRLPVLKGVPIVVLTTSSHPGDLARAYDLDARAFFVKPTDYEDYLALARTLADHWIGLAQLLH